MRFELKGAPLASGWRGLCYGNANTRGDGTLARRPNYNFEKRQKELKRAKKKEKKLEEKRARKEAAAGAAVEGQADGAETEAVAAEGDEARG